MATTTLCMDMPSQLDNDHRPPGNVTAIQQLFDQEKKNAVVGLQNHHDPNSTKMDWDELDGRVKAKQPKSAQHVWELLQDLKNEETRRMSLQRCH